MTSVDRPGKVTDGTTAAVVKPASTPAVTTDPALVVAVSPTTGVVQGTPGLPANAWPTKTTDGTNVAAVKAAMTAAVVTDPALVVAVSPNNTLGTNLVQVAGQIVQTGPGAAGTGTQRVTTSTDSSTRVTDGTNTATVTAASTAAQPTDKGVVVSVHPTSQVRVGNGVQTLPPMDAPARRGYVQGTDGTNVTPAMDDPTRPGWVKVTDGTNTLPTMDDPTRRGFIGITDNSGANNVAYVSGNQDCPNDGTPALTVSTGPNSRPPRQYDSQTVDMGSAGNQMFLYPHALGVTVLTSTGGAGGDFYCEASWDQENTWREIQGYPVDGGSPSSTMPNDGVFTFRTSGIDTLRLTVQNTGSGTESVWAAYSEGEVPQWASDRQQVTFSGSMTVDQGNPNGLSAAWPVHVVDPSTSAQMPMMDTASRAGYQHVVDGAGAMQPAMDTAARAGFVKVTDGTNVHPTMDTTARRGYVTLTDGTNTAPTGDIPGRAINIKNTDGTNTAAVKAASTAAVATDPAIVVALSPNLGVVQGAAAAVASAWPMKNTDVTNVAAVKAASAAAVAADPALVVAISPNSNSYKLTDGTNTETIKAASTASVATDTAAVVSLRPDANLPTTVATSHYHRITDGTSAAAVKAASTAPVATDPALVVALSPNSPVRRGALTMASTTITTGGTAQTLLASNAARNFLLISTPATNTATIFVRFGATALADQTSIDLPAGASLVFENWVPTDSVSVIAAVTGTPVTCFWS